MKKIIFSLLLLANVALAQQIQNKVVNHIKEGMYLPETFKLQKFELDTSFNDYTYKQKSTIYEYNSVIRDSLSNFESINYSKQ
jgi:hypothetical protein